MPSLSKDVGLSSQVRFVTTFRYALREIGPNVSVGHYPRFSLPPSSRPARGPADAKIVIREFSDFQCAFCNRAQDTLQQLLTDHPNDVRIEFRHYPLAFHKDAQLAADIRRAGAHAQSGRMTRLAV